MNLRVNMCRLALILLGCEMNDYQFFHAVKAVAESHGVGSLVRDFEGWVEDRGDKTPEQVFYEEYPEYEGT